MKWIQQYSQVILVNLVILFLLIEGISLGFYWIKNKQIYYTRKEEKNQAKFPKDSAVTGVQLDDSVQFRLHPYFGYIYKVGTKFEGTAFNQAHYGNNHSFPSPYNYPVHKTAKNQYIIGIFGGSVAAQLSMFDQEEQIIAKTLKKLPQFADKEIIVLSFAAGGYKQPQQLLLLNYFLTLGQEFDMVINIDGFNEVALARGNNQNNVEISMPSSQHILPLIDLVNNNLSLQSLEIMLKIRSYQKQLKHNLREQKNCALASGYVLKMLQFQILSDRYHKAVREFDQQRTKSTPVSDSIVSINQVPKSLPDPAAYAEMVSIWAKASIAMKNVLEKQNTLYFHILQPNQYYPTERVFTSEEKQTFVVNSNPYSEAVIQGYPLLLKQSEFLVQNQVNFFNAAKVLDTEKSTVYGDDCCHYNLIGQRIFANYIAQQIVQTIQQGKVKIPEATVAKNW